MKDLTLHALPTGAKRRAFTKIKVSKEERKQILLLSKTKNIYQIAKLLRRTYYSVRKVVKGARKARVRKDTFSWNDYSKGIL
jgi:hypothetical protein